MANKDVRDAIKQSGLYYWQIADALGISESTMTRNMRKELPEEKKQEIYNAIDKLNEEV